MRSLFLVLGSISLAAAWLGPLPGLARHAFWAHMSMHMLVVAVGAPLIAMGMAGGRMDPVRSKPRLFSPIPASLLELIVVWVWHAPAFHHAARSSDVVLCLEQSTFLAAGLLVWLSAFGRDPSHRTNRTAAGIVALLLTSMHMTLLGALLALSPRPLYWHGAVLRSMTALEDQHLGGAIMLVAGGASYLLGGLWLTAGLIRASATERT